MLFDSLFIARNRMYFQPNICHWFVKAVSSYIQATFELSLHRSDKWSVNSSMQNFKLNVLQGSWFSSAQIT